MSSSERIKADRWWELLKELVLRNTGREGDFKTAVRGLEFHRYAEPGSPICHFIRPVMIVMIQGSKFIRIGSEDFKYSERECFISAVDMPVASCAIEASPEHPYLSMSIELDMEIISMLASRMPLHDKGNWNPVLGAGGHEIDSDLLDALLRLGELSETPDRVACMEELNLKEIHFLLLRSQSSRILHNLCSLNFPASQVIKLISWIKENYKKSFSIPDLSRKFAIAPSTLYKYFKEVTSLSPIQYQKRLRLCEARRLLESGKYKIGEISQEMGYESSTQFSREYKRLFGYSPKRQGKL